jgi:uncharacterized protein (DUF58 family)
MAEHPSEIVARPAGRGWSRWLAALLFGVLLLLTLLIASWFLRPRRRRPSRRPIRHRC